MVKSGLQKALDGYRDSTKSTILFLARVPYDLEEKAEVDIKEVFARCKYIIVPAEVGEKAKAFCNGVFKEESEWPYGATSLGNHIYQSFIYPKTAEVDYKLSSKNWKGAFADALGLALFYHSDDQIIQDNEVYTDMEGFMSNYTSFALVWRDLLKLDYRELNMQSEEHKQRLKKFLNKTIQELNSVLSSMYEHHWDETEDEEFPVLSLEDPKPLTEDPTNIAA